MRDDVVIRRDMGELDKTGWGQLLWKISGEAMPGSETTFGTCTILPGERNPLHSHPDCEEILYVVSGQCDHKLGEDVFSLKPGDAIRIPRTVPHWAKCTGDEPLFALIFFSSGQRSAVNHEGDGTA